MRETPSTLKEPPPLHFVSYLTRASCYPLAFSLLGLHTDRDHAKSIVGISTSSFCRLCFGVAHTSSAAYFGDKAQTLQYCCVRIAPPMKPEMRLVPSPCQGIPVVTTVPNDEGKQIDASDMNADQDVRSPRSVLLYGTRFLRIRASYSSYISFQRRLRHTQTLRLQFQQPKRRYILFHKHTIRPYTYSQSRRERRCSQELWETLTTSDNWKHLIYQRVRSRQTSPTALRAIKKYIRNAPRNGEDLTF